MEPTFEANVPQSNLDDAPGRFSAAKQKIGQFGRKLKKIEIRETIVDHPFVAIGIAAGIGAIIAIARPAPNRSRVGGLVMAGLSALGLRFLREAAIGQLGVMAKDWLTGAGGSATGASGENAEYSPAYTGR